MFINIEFDCCSVCTCGLGYPKVVVRARNSYQLSNKLSAEKLDAIRDVGFGGLLQLAYKELCFELCQCIIAHYDVAYQHMKIEGDHILRITINDVQDVMGIPCTGVCRES